MIIQFRRIAPASFWTALLSILSFPLVAEDYSMRGIPAEDPRWQNILDHVNRSIAEKAKAAAVEAEEKTVEILQSIEGASYLARMRTPAKDLGSVAQLLNQTSGSRETQTPPGEWETIRLNFPEGTKPLPDGEKFLKRIEETGEMFQYTNTLGAKATVKICRIAGTGEEFRPIPMDEFAARLQKGETWTVTISQVTKPCNFCRGAKVVDGATCRQCKGIGGDAITRTISIKW